MNLTSGGDFVSRADEYRRRAQQCLEMAGTFRDRDARATLSHMAQAWLRLEDSRQDAKDRPRPTATANSTQEGIGRLRCDIRALSQGPGRRRIQI